jgi:hypothetical protein
LFQNLWGGLQLGSVSFLDGSIPNDLGASHMNWFQVGARTFHGQGILATDSFGSEKYQKVVEVYALKPGVFTTCQ